MLSHHMIEVGVEIPSSVSKDWSQITSIVPLDNDLYSLSMEEQAIVGCFLATQETRLLPK